MTGNPAELRRANDQGVATLFRGLADEIEARGLEYPPAVALFRRVAHEVYNGLGLEPPGELLAAIREWPGSTAADLITALRAAAAAAAARAAAV